MGSSRSGWLVGKGSGVITSKPAAHSLLSFRAEYRASWSTTPTNQTKYCNTLLPNPFKFILKTINYLSCNTVHVVLCYSREDQQPWRIGCKTLNKTSSLNKRYFDSIHLSPLKALTEFTTESFFNYIKTCVKLQNVCH